MINRENLYYDPYNNDDYYNDIPLRSTDEFELEEQPKYLSTMGDYLDFIFPRLSYPEHIGIFLKNEYRHRTEFFDNKEEVELLSRSAFRGSDTYITLSTCIRVDGNLAKASENMYKRYCLGFDFDKKDFKGKLKHIHDFTRHFKETTGLYIHFVIDSGNGYHIYVGIEETTDIERVANITKRYAVLSGADLANISKAQSLRLPNTLNHKDPKYPIAVNIVTGHIKDEKFRRYSLDYLESNLKRLEKKTGISTQNMSNKARKNYKTLQKEYRGIYPCINKMLTQGVYKGERNKSLGRLVSYFRDIARVSPETALEAILNWNERCSDLCSDADMKTDKEVTSDFWRYWKNTQYNLLGCISETNPISHILEKYCDRANCPKHRPKPLLDSNKFFILDNRYIKDKCLRDLKGYAYVILRILIENEKEYSASQLVETTGFSEQTVARTLKSLLELNLINKYAKGINLYRSKNFAPPKDKQFITIPTKLFEMFMNKEIKEAELVLYLAIRRNAYAGKKCTQAVLGRILGLTERSISRITKEMVDNGILEVEQRGTGDFIKKAGRNIEKVTNFYYFPLELEDDESL